MASPHAAGTAALYIAQNGRANNAAGVDAIRQALIDHAENLGFFVIGDADINNEAILNANFDATPPPPQNNEPPVANFGVTCVNLDCDFTDSSTDPDGNGDIQSWSWDFGDTSTSSDQNPLHSYSEPGDYLVTLTVMDAESGDSETKTVTVSESPPPAGLNVTGITPDSMQATDPPVVVAISGSGFGIDPNDVTVTFQNGSGPAPVATIDSVTDSNITATVTAKANGKKGTVAWEVAVTTSKGSDVLPGGFTVTR